MPLRFEQGQREHMVGTGWTVVGQEVVLRATTEKHVAAATCEDLRAVIADQVERLAERRPPRLVPTQLTTGVASAVVLPPPHAVRARPCALVDARVSIGRHFVDELRGIQYSNARGA